MELSHIFSLLFAYDFIRGPLVWISFIVFIIGTGVQVIRFSSLLRNQDIQRIQPGPGRFISNPSSSDGKKSLFLWLKLSIAGVKPFMTIVSLIFHFLLIVMPFLVLGHNILLDNAFGISMVSLPEEISDLLTQVVILCTMIFLFQRIFFNRLKIITGWQDFLFLALAAAPFITGYLASHQVFLHYRLMISLHILSGELMLMAIPFTKFIHMIFFLMVRFSVANEYCLGKGNKTW